VHTPFTLGHFRVAVGAFFTALAAGTVDFWLTLDESLFQSFYRGTVTISLTGIDSKPDNVGGGWSRSC